MEKISLEDFATIFVFEALCLAEKNLSVGEFDSQLYSSVSQKTGVAEKGVLYVHHSFYHEFFRNSLFEYSQPKTNGEKTRVRLTRAYTQEEVDCLLKSILDEHQVALPQRFRTALQLT